LLGRGLAVNHHLELLLRMVLLVCAIAGVVELVSASDGGRETQSLLEVGFMLLPVDHVCGFSIPSTLSICMTRGRTQLLSCWRLSLPVRHPDRCPSRRPDDQCRTHPV